MQNEIMGMIVQTVMSKLAGGTATTTSTNSVSNILGSLLGGGSTSQAPASEAVTSTSGINIADIISALNGTKVQETADQVQQEVGSNATQSQIEDKINELAPSIISAITKQITK
jgi:hypothetical protein